MLLGYHPRKRTPYAYRTITLYGPPSQAVRLRRSFITPRPVNSPAQNGPTTPHMQHLSALTHMRFSLIRVRSPLLTESQLFSFPMGTEMFHFPTFPPTTLYIQVEVAGHNSGHFRGFPIRTSTDQSSFTNSPWLIAGYNVLHRLLMPRHPPTALSSLSPKKYQNKQKLQRCSRPLYNSQTTPRHAAEPTQT